MQIRINLLPPEYRKKEMTPLATLLPVLVTFTLSLGAGAFWAWNHFGALARVELENEEVKASWQTRQKPLKYLADLRSEESDYGARSKTIAEIANSRVPWTLKLDQLCDLVADDDNGDRYLVWLSDFQVKRPQGGNRRAKVKTGETVTMDGLCFSQDHPLQRFIHFHERLMSHDYFADFLTVNNPAGQAVTMDDELKPDRAWTVKLEMVMRSRSDKKTPIRRTGRRLEAERGKAGGTNGTSRNK